MEIRIKVQPFRIPNYIVAEPLVASRGEAILETPKWPISEASPELLDFLCKQFRKEIFEKAEKIDPMLDIGVFHNN